MREDHIHDGYVSTYEPEHHFANKKGYVREHRLIWEAYNDANLMPWTHIHHINGDRMDNRIENLQAMMAVDHCRQEGKLGGRPHKN